jgi:DMSO/TMAO reductase YedYZ molybdopterin-dependent catalytic subunit
MNSAQRRTTLSFTVLIVAALALAFGWKKFSTASEDEEIAPALRQVFELNGALWKKLYRPNAKNICQAPPKGKAARVNGTIGLRNIDPATWHLEVKDDDHQFKVSLEDLKALPRTETASEFRCIEGWSEDMSFAGVKFSDFMAAYHLPRKAYVGLVSVDGNYYVSIDMESMLHEQTLLAYEQNGVALSTQHGAPLRLMIPNKYGIKNIKQVGRIFFSDQRPPDYWAEQGYDWHASL